MAVILDNIDIVNMSGLGQGDVIKMATLKIRSGEHPRQ
jgi:hypothetical protein